MSKETIEYWKQNAEEDYRTTPISVLKYIGELESRLADDGLVLEQARRQVEYHMEQKSNRVKVEDYSQAIYHDTRMGALEDLLLWHKMKTSKP